MVSVVPKVFDYHDCCSKNKQKKKELGQMVRFVSVTGYESVNRHKMEALTILLVFSVTAFKIDQK